MNLDLGPLLRLFEQTDEVAESACGEVGKEIVQRVKSRLPRVTGNLQESITAKTGVAFGHAYAVVGPDSKITDTVAGRSVRPVSYMGRVDRLHGHWMRTALNDDDVAALRDAAMRAIEQVLDGSGTVAS